MVITTDYDLPANNWWGWADNSIMLFLNIVALAIVIGEVVWVVYNLRRVTRFKGLIRFWIRYPDIPLTIFPEYDNKLGLMQPALGELDEAPYVSDTTLTLITLLRNYRAEARSVRWGERQVPGFEMYLQWVRMSKQGMTQDGFVAWVDLQDQKMRAAYIPGRQEATRFAPTQSFPVFDPRVAADKRAF